MMSNLYTLWQVARLLACMPLHFAWAVVHVVSWVLMQTAALVAGPGERGDPMPPSWHL